MSNEVTNPGNPAEEFQKRIADKLRADIGDLMPDEVLREMTEKVMHEAFFAKSYTKDRWGNIERTEENLIQKVVNEQLAESVKGAARQFVQANKADLIKLVEAEFRNGVVAFIIESFGQAARGAAAEECYRLANKMREAGFEPNYWGHN